MQKSYQILLSVILNQPKHYNNIEKYNKICPRKKQSNLLSHINDFFGSAPIVLPFPCIFISLTLSLSLSQLLQSFECRLFDCSHFMLCFLFALKIYRFTFHSLLKQCARPLQIFLNDYEENTAKNTQKHHDKEWKEKIV